MDNGQQAIFLFLTRFWFIFGVGISISSAKYSQRQNPGWLLKSVKEQLLCGKSLSCNASSIVSFLFSSFWQAGHDLSPEVIIRSRVTPDFLKFNKVILEAISRRDRNSQFVWIAAWYLTNCQAKRNSSSLDNGPDLFSKASFSC